MFSKVKLLLLFWCSLGFTSLGFAQTSNNNISSVKITTNVSKGSATYNEISSNSICIDKLEALVEEVMKTEEWEDIKILGISPAYSFGIYTNFMFYTKDGNTLPDRVNPSSIDIYSKYGKVISGHFKMNRNGDCSTKTTFVEDFQNAFKSQLELNLNHDDIEQGRGSVD